MHRHAYTYANAHIQASRGTLWSPFTKSRCPTYKACPPTHTTHTPVRPTSPPTHTPVSMAILYRLAIRAEQQLLLVSQDPTDTFMQYWVEAGREVRGVTLVTAMVYGLLDQL